MIDIPNKMKSILIKMGSENADQMTYNLLLIGGMVISVFAFFESGIEAKVRMTLANPVDTIELSRNFGYR